MLFPALVLFLFFLLLSAFFSSSATAFVASNPLKIDFLEKKGSKAAGFFLAEFGSIPQLEDRLEFNGHEFIIKEMHKRRINTIHVILKSGEEV